MWRVSIFGGQTTDNVSARPTCAANRLAGVAFRGLNLQNLSVETLAYIYENTLVSEPARREQSVHATPTRNCRLPSCVGYHLRSSPRKTAAFSSLLPVMPPFLIAGLGRLARSTALPRCHQTNGTTIFVRMLSGPGKTTPSHERIARYSLILADYPNGDSWRVDVGDVYTGAAFDTYLRQAKSSFSATRRTRKFSSEAEGATTARQPWSTRSRKY